MPLTPTEITAYAKSLGILSPPTADQRIAIAAILEAKQPPALPTGLKALATEPLL